MAVYMYPDNPPHEKMWVVPETRFSIQDIIEALWIPDGSYTIEQLSTSPNILVTCVDPNISELIDDVIEAPYHIRNWRGYGYRYFPLEDYEVCYQNLHEQHVEGVYGALMDGIPSLPAVNYYPTAVSPFRGNKWSRHVFFLSPGEFVNIYYNLRPYAAPYPTNNIQHSRFSLHDQGGLELFRAESFPGNLHYGNDVYSYPFVKRTSVDGGYWMYGIHPPLIYEDGFDYANNYSLWLYNPSNETRRYFLEFNSFDVSNPEPNRYYYSSFFKIFKSPVEFPKGYWYKNYKSYSYKFYYGDVPTGVLGVDGGSSDGGLRFKVEAFNSQHQSLGLIGLTNNSQTKEEWSHTSNLEKYYSFNVPYPNTNYIIVHVSSPIRVTKFGMTKCNHQIRVTNS
jgi:hypothetical protein